MIRHPVRSEAGSTDLNLAPGLQGDDLIGAIQFSPNGIDGPPANGDFINNADHSIDNTDHFVGIGDFFANEDSVNASGNNADHSVVDDLANASDGSHTIDHSVVSSATDNSDLPGSNQNLIVETHPSSDSSLKNDHLSSLFDHIDSFNFDHVDNLTDAFTNATVGDAFSTPSGHSFDLPAANAVGVPDVFADAKGGSHGGGGGGGGGWRHSCVLYNSQRNWC